MNRFELEEKIMDVWGTDKDLEYIYKHVMEVETLDRDHLANALLGLAALHNMKSQELFSVFETLVSNGTIE